MLPKGICQGLVSKGGSLDFHPLICKVYNTFLEGFKGQGVFILED
jgi:hypothetical protein